MNSIGSVTLDLRPGPGNPRNSEGAFCTLTDGSILFVYSKFTGKSGADDGYACIACRVSSDGGETWSGDRVLFTPKDHNSQNVASVSLLTMEDGAVGLFHGVKYGFHDARLHLRRSTDQGRTWSDAEPCIPYPGYFVTNNDRVVRLASGRILAPANLHRCIGLDVSDWKSWDARGIPCMFYSDDDGHTWRESSGTCFISLPYSKTGFQESGVIQLKNGALLQWMRTDMGRQYESISIDDGDTWSVPVPSRFTGPDSPLSMKRIPGSGKLLAVWNPIPNYNGRVIRKGSGGRTPLVLATSNDDGRTWSDPVGVEDDPEHGYCYIAIHFAGDSVLLAYCAGGPEDGGCLARSVIRKIPINALP